MPLADTKQSTMFFCSVGWKNNQNSDDNIFLQCRTSQSREDTESVILSKSFSYIKIHLLCIHMHEHVRAQVV